MKLNKKLIIMLASVIGVIVVLIIVIMLFAGSGSKKLSYEKIEEKIIAAGESYFEDNDEELPDTGTKIIDVGALVEAGYLKDLSEYTSEDVTCDGKLYVAKNPSGYSYRAILDCGKKYLTKSLSGEITKNVVTSGSGLYEMEQVDIDDVSKTQTVYVFRGDNVNNYIKIGERLWQIVKVYQNGEIAIVGDPDALRTNWDNRYNIDVKKYSGINDYSVSRMRDSITTKVINNQDGYLKIKSFITTHTACIGKRSLEDDSRDGSAECAEILEEQYFSLIPTYEYMNASLDVNCNKALDSSCSNYNYLSNMGEESWTITGVLENSQDVYFIDKTLDIDNAKGTKSVRLYAHLDPSVMLVSGTGTYNDPYIIK